MARPKRSIYQIERVRLTAKEIAKVLRFSPFFIPKEFKQFEAAERLLKAIEADLTEEIKLSYTSSDDTFVRLNFFLEHHGDALINKRLGTMPADCFDVEDKNIKKKAPTILFDEIILKDRDFTTARRNRLIIEAAYPDLAPKMSEKPMPYVLAKEMKEKMRNIIDHNKMDQKELKTHIEMQSWLSSFFNGKIAKPSPLYILALAYTLADYNRTTFNQEYLFLASKLHFRPLELTQIDNNPPIVPSLTYGELMWWDQIIEKETYKAQREAYTKLNLDDITVDIAEALKMSMEGIKESDIYNDYLLFMDDLLAGLVVQYHLNRVLNDEYGLVNFAKGIESWFMEKVIFDKDNVKKLELLDKLEIKGVLNILYRLERKGLLDILLEKLEEKGLLDVSTIEKFLRNENID